jgi:amino acid adenylation domain-containing protein
MNTLVLRTDLSTEPTFVELMRRVHETHLGALSHADMPFEKLVELFPDSRGTRASPFFQVLFTYHSYPIELPGMKGLECRSYYPAATTSKFELTLELQDTAEGLQCLVEYRTDLFDRPAIERLLGHFERLLESIVAHPEEKISQLGFLSESEQLQVLSAGCPPRIDWSADVPVHTLFEEQARQQPHPVAVRLGDACLTYGELNGRAEMLARRLVEGGVKCESRVGICLDRSPDMVAALLAVWKAGAAYVPLDPAFPAERLRFMAEDARLDLVLTETKWQDRLGVEVQCLCLDRPDVWRGTSEATLPAVHSGQLAYIIYTSGSTGRPKGTMIEHRALTNFLRSMAQEPGMRAGQSLLSVTTLSFDIAGLELWLPLSVGGEVILVSREVASHGTKLKQELARRTPDLMQATPVTWKMLLEAGWTGGPRLTLLCGGEAMSADLARDLRTRGGALWNMYGPTETTVWSTLQKVTEDEDLIPIGRPIANTQVYVLDAKLQPAPLGIAGELFIGGDGLARGYWRREDLTTERFVPNPYGPGRLYRTGDLARFRPDGLLECLGRLDHQVKIRGFRIELGEIEARLREAPGVREAVVTAHGEGADRELVAYVLRDGPACPATKDLRAHLGTRLPDYMLPAHFEFLEKLPLTPNGKIDRKALPAPSRSGREQDQEYQPAGTPTQAVLVEILQKILKVDRLGIADNFFDLGAHSLALVRAHDALSRHRPSAALIDFFQYPTIRALAAHLDRSP